MYAIVCTKYGKPNVLQPQEVPTPSPAADELLVQIHATTVTAGDVRIRRFKVPLASWIPARLFLGILRPRQPILGMECAGEVVAVGPDVTRYQVGDKVYAMTLWMKFGTYATYKTMPQDGFVTMMPANMTYEEAAAVPVGGITALGMWNKAGLQAGQSVLVYGASGSVGTFAVQLATYRGATVTGVCSTSNLALVRGLGAETAIDYTTTNYATQSARYDIVLDAVGKTSAKQAQAVLKPSGQFISVRGYSAKPGPDLLDDLRRIIEDGGLRSAIDRRYPLAQAAEAHAYVEQGHKKGNVVLMVG